MPTDLPLGWSEHKNSDGRTYYYNKVQATSQWERPDHPDLSGMLSSGSIDKPGDVPTQTAGYFLAFATKYFNVTTQDIKRRLLHATLPYRLLSSQDKDPQLQAIKENPDIYGPFWICVTVAFSLFMSTHAYSWASDAFTDTHYMTLYTSLLTTLCFWLIPPILVRLLAVFNGSPAEVFNLCHCICIQGYSLWPIIPMSILCTIPSKVLQIMFVLVALGVSVSYIMINIIEDVTQVSKRVRISILFTLVGCQTLHFLLFPAYFFRLPQFSNVKDQIA